MKHHETQKRLANEEPKKIFKKGLQVAINRENHR